MTAFDNTWIDIGEKGRALPDFPDHALPDSLRDFTKAISSAMQVPPALAFAFSLGVASSAVVGRINVQPKPAAEPGYLEPAQMFILAQGESGERKTPLLNALKQPLVNYLSELRLRIQQENEKSEMRIRALEKKNARERDVEESVAQQTEIKQLREKQQAEPEYCAADYTMEATVQSMDEHNGRAILLFDEGDFLSVLAGRAYQREGASTNLTPVLAGFCNSSYEGRRVTRGEWHIPRCSMAICLGVQPKLLRDFCADGNGLDRGLHARFLYFLSDSLVGHRSDVGGTVSKAYSTWWTTTIRRMASLARNGDPYCLRFTPQAEEAYRAFWREIEKRLIGDLDGPLKSWGSKLVGNAVRMAGLFALIDDHEQVERQHWEAAQEIAAEYFIPCAKSLFLGEDPNLSDDAKKLLPKLRQYESFSASDFWKSSARNIMDAESCYLALDCLRERGYIRYAAVQPSYYGSGRKPSPVFDVNPALRKKETKADEVEV